MADHYRRGDPETGSFVVLLLLVGVPALLGFAIGFAIGWAFL